MQQRKRLLEMIAEIDEDNTGEIDFLEFLQLMRKFVDDREAEYMRKEKAAAQRANFSADETKLWRTIFLKFDEDKSGEFDSTEGKVLLQAVGINLNERTMHDEYLRLFREADEDQSESIDFPEFLILMRRLLDIDFGGISSKVRRGVQK